MLLVEVDLLIEPANVTVDPNTNETVLACVLEQIFMFALLVHTERGEEHEASTLLVENGFSHLLHGLALHGTAAVVAVRVAYPRVKQP